jgi:transcriptional regulator with XRE-family HTH domain
MTATMSRARKQERTEVGRRVRRERRLAGLTQVELAEKAGLSEDAVWRLEVGRARHPRISTIRKIAEVLGVEVRDLIDE